MNIKKEEAKKICKNYRLGELKKITPIKDGWVNYSFETITNKGIFIIQIFGPKYIKGKKKSVKLEFEVLNFLNKNNFPYKTPLPIKNIKGKYVTKYYDDHLWVYKKIKGIVKRKFSKKDFLQLVKAQATFHKYIKNFKQPKKKEEKEISKLLNKMKKMKNIKPKNKTDRLVLKNVDLFINLLKELSKKNLEIKKSIIHGDLTEGNVIFDKEKMVGIIDFDNIEYSTRIKDITLTLKKSRYLGMDFNAKKTKLFFKEYEKQNKISKKEKELIISLMILDNCILLWWFYNKMRKNLDKRHYSISNVIKGTKKLKEKL